MDAAHQEKLEQLRGIVAADNGQHDIQILESVGWDVQRAVALLFDDTPAASTSGQPPSAASAEPIATGRNIEQFDIDEPTSTPARRAGRSYGEIATNAIVYTLALPLTVAFNLVSYTFRFLRIPFPRLTSRPFHLRFNWNSFASLWRPPKYESPGVIAERWVRRLEDELGALTWGRAAASEEGTTKEIPDFYLGSYQDALMAAKRELKILCVILITDEHDDVPQFKMNTLTDPTFNSLLRNEGMIVWGGDVSTLDPYSASLKLGATTYPFVSFIALQPTRLPTAPSSGASPAPSRDIMSVLSRQAGARACTPQALTRHIEERLLPRVKPILERYRSEEVARVRDRVDREESERRVLEAQMRDSERILRAREERERAQRDEDERIRAAENKRRAEENAKRLVRARRAFWARSGQELGPEPDKSEVEIVRLTLRLPNGGRVVRQFRPSDGVSVLYSFVSSNLVSGADNESHSDDPYDANNDGWGFALATAFPRVPIPWVPYSADGKGGSTVGTVSNGALKGGAVVVVETSAAAAPMASQGDDTLNGDDEYISE